MTPGAGADPLRLAEEVVGLYGDPDTTWGIGVDITLERPVDLTGADARLEALVQSFPHLGPPPGVERMDDGWGEQVSRSVSAPFGPDGRLVRVLVDGSGTRLFVAAHHGVCDGLGLLAIAECVAGCGLVPHARGIGRRSSQRSFLVSSFLRLLEALTRPPVRFGGTSRAEESWDRMLSAQLPAVRIPSSVMCLAVARVYDRWPGRTRPGRRRLLVLLGASRRAPGTLAPDRQTAYFRLPVDPRWSATEARRRFATVDPEPDFPETSAGGIGPLITHLLRNRLGGTAVVSNLGRVSGQGVLSLGMFPALNGPRAVGVGVATTGTTTTVTVRTRSSEFSEQETRALLDGVVDEVRALATAPLAP